MICMYVLHRLWRRETGWGRVGSIRAIIMSRIFILIENSLIIRYFIIILLVNFGKNRQNFENLVDILTLILNFLLGI